MGSAVVAGHVCVDLIPELPVVPPNVPGELVEVGPLGLSAGGCVANTAAGLAALGAEVEAVGDAGDDELGATLVRMLAARGTRADQIRLLEGRSTSYSVVVQPPGRDRSFWHHVGANAEFDGSAVRLDGAELLHVGYPSLLPRLIADGGAALEALLGRAREAGVTTSLDLAVLDPQSAAARHDWPALLRRVLPLVDVLSPSVDDVRTTLGIDGPPSGVARTLMDMGAAVVLVTAGAEGQHLRAAPRERLARAGRLFESAERQAAWGEHDEHALAAAVEVRTTLGAGDAATAGLLFGILTGLAPGESLALAVSTAAARVSEAPVEPALRRG